LKKGAKVSVTNWNTVTEDIGRLKLLIDLTFTDRLNCDYDLSRSMKRADS